MEYRVTLDVFEGPLDLLLYLVKREEVDILDIPIAKIAEQFREYLQVVAFVDVDQAGEFLVMAATLMEIKSRMLLPHEQSEKAELEDPRSDLVKQLLEYRKYKETAFLLQQRAQERAKLFTRSDPLRQPQAKTPTLRPAELWDLVAAFTRLMRETQLLAPRTIVVDETPMHVYQTHIRQRLTEHPRSNFRDFFTPPYSRGRLLGLFLAMLELIKTGEITIEQEQHFGTIWLCRLDPTHTPSNNSSPLTPDAASPDCISSSPPTPNSISPDCTDSPPPVLDVNTNPPSGSDSPTAQHSSIPREAA